MIVFSFLEKGGLRLASLMAAAAAAAAAGSRIESSSEIRTGPACLLLENVCLGIHSM